MKFYNKDIALHSNMCLIGGFMGCYAIMCRSENLGSAQTTNLIQLMVCILGNNIYDFILRLIGFGLYVSAILICVILKKKTLLNMHKYAIAIDALGLIGVAFFPLNINPVVGILPIFFMMSTQWSVFHGVGKYNSSTIFSTNNLRQCITSFGEYIFDKKVEQKEKSKFFGNSLLWYHIGVLGGFFACKFFAVYASLLCLPVTLLAFVIESCNKPIRNN